MLTFDGEYSVMVHFELTEEQALDAGGVDWSRAKNSIKELPDWLLQGITDIIDLRNNDTVTVIPVEGVVKQDGKEVDMDAVPDYTPAENEEDEVN